MTMFETLIIIFCIVFLFMEFWRIFIPRRSAKAEKVAETTRLLSNLVPITIWLVVEAEDVLRRENSLVKRAYVMDKLYRRIPDEYKKYITENNLNSIITNALQEVTK